MFKHKRAVIGETILSIFGVIAIVFILVIFAALSGIISLLKFNNASPEAIKDIGAEHAGISLEAYLNTPVKISSDNYEAALRMSELIILAAATDSDAYKSQIIRESQGILGIFTKSKLGITIHCYSLQIGKIAGESKELLINIGDKKLSSLDGALLTLPVPSKDFINVKMVIDNQCLK